MESDLKKSLPVHLCTARGESFLSIHPTVDSSTVFYVYISIVGYISRSSLD